MVFAVIVMGLAMLVLAALLLGTILLISAAVAAVFLAGGAEALPHQRA